MNYSHRFFLYAPVAGVAALAVALSLYWLEASSALSRRLDMVNGHAVMPGVTLHFAHKTISGFPFRVDAVLDDLSVDVATPRGPIEWSTPHFAMHSLDYGALHLIFEAAGRQHIAWHDAQGKAHTLDFTPGILRASALGRGGAVDRIDIELLAAAGPAFTVSQAEFHLRKDPDKNALDLVAMADNLRWDRDAASVLKTLRLEALIAPGAAWDGLLSGHADWPHTLSHFHGVGGTLTVSKLALDWGKAGATGSGRLALDAQLRPQGLMHLTLTGTADKIDGHGILPALMGAANGGAIPVSLAFKDGIAYVNATPVGFADPLN